jgi:signal peptidase I
MSESKNKEEVKPTGGVEDTLKQWGRDLVEVLVTLGIIIIILRVLLGADMIVPLVVVTSGSMVHSSGDNSWIHWLNERGITNQTIEEMPLGGGFNMGDMIIVMRPEAKLGDVIVYERDFIYGSRDMEPIIHRIVGVVYVNDSKVVGTEGTLDCFNREDFGRYIGYVEECKKGGKECHYPSVPESDEYKFFITKGDFNPEADQCITMMKDISIPVNEAQVKAKTLLRLPYIGWIKLIFTSIIRILTFNF